MLVDGHAERAIMSASIIHNALSALQPMKLGEFALPLMLSRLGKARLSGSLGVLMLLRAFDLRALALIGSLDALIALHGSNFTQASMVAVVALSVAALQQFRSSRARGTGFRRCLIVLKSCAALMRFPACCPLLPLRRAATR